MPTIELRFGETLFVVNLARLMEVGILVTLEVIMGLVYGKKLGKSGLVFLRMRSFPLGMEEGSNSGKIFGTERRCCILFTPPFSIWL